MTKASSKASSKPMSIAAYDKAHQPADAATCRALRQEIDRALPDASSKVWHGAPVWFVGETPVVGYSVPKKGGVSLLFWNGQAFDEAALQPVGKFKAAQLQFADVSAIKVTLLRRLLKQAKSDLWDVRSLRALRSRSAV